jgi:hypothetical protein
MQYKILSDSLESLNGPYKEIWQMARGETHQNLICGQGMGMENRVSFTSEPWTEKTSIMGRVFPLHTHESLKEVIPTVNKYPPLTKHEVYLDMTREEIPLWREEAKKRTAAVIDMMDGWLPPKTISRSFKAKPEKLEQIQRYINLLSAMRTGTIRENEVAVVCHLRYGALHEATTLIHDAANVVMESWGIENMNGCWLTMNSIVQNLANLGAATVAALMTPSGLDKQRSRYLTDEFDAISDDLSRLIEKTSGVNSRLKIRIPKIEQDAD